MALRRGLGMFVNPGTRAKLLALERERFVTDRWPAIFATITRLGLDTSELLASTERSARSKKTTKER